MFTKMILYRLMKSLVGSALSFAGRDVDVVFQPVHFQGYPD
jgi:hypothetical protein